MMSNAMTVIIELQGCYYGLLITFYIDGRYPEEIPQFQGLCWGASYFVSIRANFTSHLNHHRWFKTLKFSIQRNA